MRCERAQELFSEYCEGSIQTALRVPFEGHLQDCSGCREQVVGLKEVWKVLDSAPVIEPPADFRAVVWRRIDAQQAARPQAVRIPQLRFDWRTLFSRPALGWAAAMLVLVLLAPMVVKGPFVGARMVFPWSLFYAKPTALHVGDARVINKNGQEWLNLKISNPGTSTVKLDVTVESGAVRNPHLTLDVPASTSGEFELTPVAQGSSEPIKLNVRWSQDGWKQSQAVTTQP
jgi:hypothetical protein